MSPGTGPNTELAFDEDCRVPGHVLPAQTCTFVCLGRVEDRSTVLR